MNVDTATTNKHETTKTMRNTSIKIIDRKCDGSALRRRRPMRAGGSGDSLL
jgi:hypothetical protein